MSLRREDVQVKMLMDDKWRTMTDKGRSQLLTLSTTGRHGHPPCSASHVFSCRETWSPSPSSFTFSTSAARNELWTHICHHQHTHIHSIRLVNTMTHIYHHHLPTQYYNKYNVYQKPRAVLWQFVLNKFF